NTYGYGGTTGYFSFLVSAVFLKGGILPAGHYTMNASVKFNSTAAAISSAPVAFTLVTSKPVSNLLIVFIAVDIIVIAVIVWVFLSMRRRRK
ncbi:MAG: hypothetical protein QXP70_06120, partial [Methanomassiliicoccales archaeon]